MNIKITENAAKLTVLTETKPFLLRKYSLDSCVPWLNFQSPENVYSDHFPSVLIVFMEEHSFRGSSSTTLEVLPSLVGCQLGLSVVRSSCHEDLSGPRIESRVEG